MGLFDSLSGGLKDALGQAEAAAMPALISAVLAKTDLGDMQGLLDIGRFCCKSPKLRGDNFSARRRDKP
jgi:hypothetical protein